MSAIEAVVASGAEPLVSGAPPAAFGTVPEARSALESAQPTPVTLASPGSPLAQIAFSDLYLEADGLAWYKKAPNDRQGHRLSGILQTEARALLQDVEQMTLNDDDSFGWGGLILRAKCLPTLKGPVYVFRRIIEKPLDFHKIGYPSRLSRALMAAEFDEGGLVLIAGRTGSGKTTSLTAYVAERLRTFGGIAVTAENPIEVQMQGRYAGLDGIAGVCYQTQVKDDRDFGPRIRDFMRAAPNIIMLGEMRTADAAGQAVLAATSGHLVVVSVHGRDPVSVIDRVKNLVNESGYDVSLFADSLLAVVHQQMLLENINGEDRRRIVAKPLVVKNSVSEGAIRAHIRGGVLEQMVSEVERQERVMKMPGNMGEF
ncbi:ATPase, T2SS/T4P/T4SS family [Paraburkholderia aromaticivorans]|uniref:ATPase, T2SS/T4P/T4SS family n=1 Tax=Paraburkholderia aromaticivorans TaxID=2026199 RepID=UPI0014561326|nr:ATPase, T2SS/T4P/T4SS family [Paraburkholderia aromaticivorans]